MTSGKGQTVLVAGATGGTGRALVRDLQSQGYTVRAFVRDKSKARPVLGDEVSYVTGDVREIDTIYPAMQDVAYVISAIGSTRSDPTNNPEAVDFGGVKNLADAAAAAGVRQFVLVSSSGVTDKDHFLNKQFDNILNWKFKGEQALRMSGVPYTIVRPGGLVNTPPGEFAVIFAQGDTTGGRISREDLASVCVAALQVPDAINKTFEVFNGETSGENHWNVLFASLVAD
ncbi:MAG: SDR family oxidoreductase [Gammaproteobacteria bacterium]|nr:SDR family oxidoreductase [Gammaproteobacteria bacterium]MCP4088572.1 SDR family oxidoreductase [Gammaproteobacteria bacterium]MCP4276520.1 SDR family oxidoreductase [Gammaproteobacteria bacterium]MCP4832397.1 SDR family oxidoreductase [Gammaproteobacteria bacterium]MCP4929089.1 SDR family oxidoreductase [Gammaproteobacteria bacterium]